MVSNPSLSNPPYFLGVLVSKGAFSGECLQENHLLRPNSQQVNKSLHGTSKFFQQYLLQLGLTSPKGGWKLNEIFATIQTILESFAKLGELLFFSSSKSIGFFCLKQFFFASQKQHKTWPHQKNTTKTFQRKRSDLPAEWQKMMTKAFCLTSGFAEPRLGSCQK